MKRILIAACLLMASPLIAQLTTISQFVANADGSAFAGEVVIQVPPFASRSYAVRSRDIWLCSTANIITGCAQQIVNGVLTVALLPNGGGSPAGTSYFVSYYPDVPPGRRPSVKTEYWVVPAGGPFTIDQVKVGTPPVPTVQISPTQLNPAGYSTGQYPCLQAGAFAPCGPTAGATWGQITGTLSNQTDLSAALAGKAPVANGVVPVTIDPAGNPNDGFNPPVSCALGTLPQINTTNGRLWICVGTTHPAWSYLDLRPIVGSQVLTSSYPSNAGTFVATSDGSEIQLSSNCAVWRVPIPNFKAVLGGGAFDVDCLLFTNNAAQLTGGRTLSADSNSLLVANAVRWKAGQTVGTLGTCNSANVRATAYVTDANTPTFLGAVTGGGSTSVPVICNGTAWIAY